MKKLLAVLILAVSCSASDLGRYVQGGFDVRVQSGMKTPNPIPGVEWEAVPVITMAISCSDPDVVGAIIEFRITVRDRASRRGYGERSYSQYVIMNGSTTPLEIEMPDSVRSLDSLTVIPTRRSASIPLKIAINI